jgi:hypothetical protein
MHELAVAGLAVSVGLASCFFGRRVFRPLLPVLGGLYALVLAGQAAGPEEASLVWLLATGVAVLLAVAVYAASSALVAAAGGALLAVGAGALLASALGLATPAALVLGLLAGLALGLMPTRGLEQRIVISSAFGGSALALYGLGQVVLPALAALGGLHPLVLVGNWLVLGFIGLNAQAEWLLAPAPILRQRSARCGR